MPHDSALSLAAVRPNTGVDPHILSPSSLSTKHLEQEAQATKTRKLARANLSHPLTSRLHGAIPSSSQSRPNGPLSSSPVKGASSLCLSSMLQQARAQHRAPTPSAHTSYELSLTCAASTLA
ncbi:hypothetical protein ACFX2G_022875 [Malus domestica]